MEIVCIAIQVWLGILFIRVIVSLVMAFGHLPDGLRPAYKILIDLTEPVLAPVRRAIPPAGMLDLSTLVVFLIGQFILAAVCTT